jgi:membrane protein YdbS with pleckstrin-like domain
MTGPDRPEPLPPDDDDTAFLGVVEEPAPRVPRQAPPVDGEQLGGGGASQPGAGGESLNAPPPVIRRRRRPRRVAPLQDAPSRLTARYLFPSESFRGEWRLHAIHIANPLTAAVIATVALGGLAGAAEAYLDPSAAYTPWVAPLSTLAWFGIMGWVGLRIAYWHFYRFILTNKRVMVVEGIIARHVAMMPLARVTDMKYEQSPTGRMLNFGTFVIESAGQEQALREIPHLPNPNDLYLQVVEEMYEPDAVEERLRSAREREEDEVADA